MSEKVTFVLHNDDVRAAVHRFLTSVPDGYVVEIKPPTRTLEQSARFHAAVRDVSRQVEWYGRKLPEEVWKIMFVASLYKQQVFPDLNGDGMLVINAKTSRLTTREMGDLTDFVYAFGAQHGVEFSE